MGVGILLVANEAASAVAARRASASRARSSSTIEEEEGGDSMPLATRDPTQVPIGEERVVPRRRTIGHLDQYSMRFTNHVSQILAHMKSKVELAGGQIQQKSLSLQRNPGSLTSCGSWAACRLQSCAWRTLLRGAVSRMPSPTRSWFPTRRGPGRVRRGEAACLARPVGPPSRCMAV